MKNFDFLLCFLGLCVLPCVFSDRTTSQDDMIDLAKAAGITTGDLQECLNKLDTNLDTMLIASEYALTEDFPEALNMKEKVECFTACIYNKNGMLANSKIMPERAIELATRVTRRPGNIPRMRTAIIECTKQVSDKTEDCDISFSFSRCFVKQMARRN